MLNYSNLTAEEVITLYRDTMPEPVLRALLAMEQQVAELKAQRQAVRRKEELMEDQLDFARNLVEAIDAWASELPAAKRKAYSVIRSDSSFEV